MRNAAVLQEYLDTGRFKEGLKQCDKRLKKTNAAADLLLYKARFLFKLGQRDEALAVASALTDQLPAITDTVLLDEIDTFLLLTVRDEQFPHVLTNGTTSNKLWAACLALTPKKTAHFAFEDRFNSAVRDRRWQDAGSAIAGWRQLEPERHDLRSMHAALFQLIASSTKDVSTARLNSMLALKNIEKMMVPNINEVDAHVIIDILIRQKNTSQLVLLALASDNPLAKLISTNYEAFMNIVAYLADHIQIDITKLTGNLATFISSLLPDSGDRILKGSGSLERARTDLRLQKATITIRHALAQSGIAVERPTPTYSKSGSRRQDLLAKMWAAHQDSTRSPLPDAIDQYLAEMVDQPFCFGDLRNFVLALSIAARESFRVSLHACQSIPKSTDVGDMTALQVRKWITAETNILKLEYLLTISAKSECSCKAHLDFIYNAARFVQVARNLLGQADPESSILLVYSLWIAYEKESDQNYLLMALRILDNVLAGQYSHPALVLAVATAKELGLGNLALRHYQSLDIKGIQLETVSHVGLAGISTLAPLAIIDGSDVTQILLKKTVDMYVPTDTGIMEQQQALLKAKRADLLLPLEDLRRALSHSVNRRMMILEQRRVSRLAGIDPTPDTLLHPPTLQMWTEDLEDRRDFNILPKLEAAEHGTWLEVRMHGYSESLGVDMMAYDLWVDEVCSLIAGKSLISCPMTCKPPAIPSGVLSPQESALTPAWESLAVASALTVSVDKERIGLYGAGEISMSHALTTLKHELDKVCGSNFAISGPRIPGFPSRTIMRHIYSAMDFIAAVGRFTSAAQAINKGKRAGNKTPPTQIDDIMESARAAFEMVKDTAAAAKHQLNEPDIDLAIGERVRMPGQDDDSDRVRETSVLCMYARQTWEGVLKLSFPV